MSSHSNLKYIERKGSDLDLDDLKNYKQPSKKRNNFFSVLNKLLFGKPIRTLSILILFVAFPITVYFILKGGNTDTSTLASKSTLEIKPNAISNLEANQDNVLEFTADGRHIDNLEVFEIIKPSWIEKTSESNQGSSGEQSKTLYYVGKPNFETTDRIALLAKAEKLDFSEICRGCDKENKFVYSLSEFSLNTKTCSDFPVWGRNPVGGENPCQKFSNDCLIPGTWKKYLSKDDCNNAHSEPEIVVFQEDAIFTYHLDCDANYLEEPFNFDYKVVSTDKDGDIVRYNLLSPGDSIELYQDSYETIVKQVSGQKGYNYFNHNYSAILKGEITKDYIGSTIPILTEACDVSGSCTSRTLEVSTIQRSECSDFEDKQDLYVNISFPQKYQVVKDTLDVIFELEGGEEYAVEANLYGDDCKDFRSHLAYFKKLDLDKNKGYSFKWNSREFENGEYCIGILASRNSYDGRSTVSDFQKFEINNENRSPYVDSYPQNTNLTTGEAFEYTIQAVDPDGDTLNLEVIDKPEWLDNDNWELSGSTVVPGSYTFTIMIDDGVNSSVGQIVNINVKPPESNFPFVDLVYPVNGSVLSGRNNEVSWDFASDGNTSIVEISYSSDGRKWYMVKSLTNGRTSFKWDVSDIDSGNYYLKFDFIEDSELSLVYTQISEAFYISNGNGPPEGQIQGSTVSMPSILNHTPEVNSVTYSKRPLVSASLHASKDALIERENVEVYFDDNNVSSECDISEKDVFCQLQNELSKGKHKVKLLVLDSKGKIAVKQWYFTIEELGSNGSNSNSVMESDEDATVKLPLINKEVERDKFILIAIFFTISILIIIIISVIHFVVKRIQKRRRQKLIQEKHRKKNLDMSSYSQKPPEFTPDR